ncbi:MAG: hypothetical protein NTZ69_16405 [Bacteroidia bacterium]|nr:hypothetical protein [Bacteroidia bacterium]
MKNSILFLAGIFFLLLSIGTKAQTPSADFFIGKWDVLVTGTPSGDSHTTLMLERIDGKLSGDFTSPNEKAIKLSKVEEKTDEVTVYFTSSNGYDVYLLLKKKDETHVSGTMLDMFNATGERIVEKKK